MSAPTDNIRIGSLTNEFAQAELINSDANVRALLARVSILSYEDDPRGAPPMSDYMVTTARVGDRMREVLLGTHYFGDLSTASTTHLIDAGEGGDVYSLVPLGTDLEVLDDETAIEVTIGRSEFVRAVVALIDADMLDMGETN